MNATPNGGNDAIWATRVPNRRTVLRPRLRSGRANHSGPRRLATTRPDSSCLTDLRGASAMGVSRDKLRQRPDLPYSAAAIVQYHETFRAMRHELSWCSDLVLPCRGPGRRRSLQKPLRCLSRSSKSSDSSTQRAPEDARKSNTPNDGFRIDDEHRLSAAPRRTRSYCKFPGN
jgi:hypothetical protein